MKSPFSMPAAAESECKQNTEEGFMLVSHNRKSKRRSKLHSVNFPGGPLASDALFNFTPQDHAKITIIISQFKYNINNLDV